MGAQHHATDGGGPDRGRGEAGRAHVSQAEAARCLLYLYNFVMLLSLTSL